MRRGLFALACLLWASSASAAISFIGFGTVATGNNAAITPTIHASHLANDLIICYVGMRGSETITIAETGSSGWLTAFQEDHSTASNGQLHLFYKITAGSETNPTFTPTGGGVGNTIVAGCATYRGVDTGDPWDVTGTAAWNGSAQNIGPIPGITPTTSQAMVLIVGYKNDDWSSVAAPTTDGLTWVDNELIATSGDDASVSISRTILAGAPSAISDTTLAVTGGLSATGGGLMLSVNAAGVAGATGHINRLLLGVGE